MRFPEREEKEMAEINFVLARTKEDLAVVEEIYQEAFPEVERKPFSMLVDAQEKGSVEILKIQEDKAETIGEIIFARYGDVVLLDYFAIARAFRGQGIGAQVLEKLQKRCEGERLILEIESTKVEADNLEQRLLRKAFYERCGMHTLDYSVMVMGVEMEILTFGCTVGFEEYHAVCEQVFGEEIGAQIQRVS